MSWSKFRSPIWVIVFDELELIRYVSQGLTLSTASLVIVIFGSVRSSGSHSVCPSVQHKLV